MGKEICYGLGEEGQSETTNLTKKLIRVDVGLCIVFVWPDFGCGGATVRSRQRLPHI